MSELIPLDISQKVGGLILTSDFRSKVDAGFQYELADLIARLMADERSSVVKYVHRQGEIHDELSGQVCDDDGEKWHSEMRNQFYSLAKEISWGRK
jgi:hypothetical protein